jgi:hypothetical protein
MDKWFKDILPDKDPYHNRGRDQMRKKGGPDFKCLCFRIVNAKHNIIIIIILTVNNLYYYPKPNTTFQWNNKNGPII